MKFKYFIVLLTLCSNVYSTEKKEKNVFFSESICSKDNCNKIFCESRDCTHNPFQYSTVPETFKASDVKKAVETNWDLNNPNQSYTKSRLHIISYNNNFLVNLVRFIKKVK